MKSRCKVTLYIDINVAEMSVMMSTLGNLPEPLKKDARNT